MRFRIAKKIVMDRVLPSAAPFIAAGGGACYSDSERLAARVYVNHMVSGIARRMSDETGGCITTSRNRVQEKLT